jgi:hypothetical protein
MDFYPIAEVNWSYGSPEWRPLTQPTNWWWAMYHYYEPWNTPYPWGQYVEVYHYPTSGSAYWGHSFDPSVLQPDIFIPGGGSTGWYDAGTPADVYVGYVPYSDLPPGFCTGA